MTDQKDNTGKPGFQSQTEALTDPDRIRQQAEQKAKTIKTPDLEAMTTEEIRQLLYEMRLKQLEAETRLEQLTSELQKYRDQVELLTTITENMREMVILADSGGNITFAGRFLEILGYSPDFLVGKNFMDFVHPEDINRAREAYKEFVAGNDPPGSQYRCRCKDGSYLWIETRGTLLRDENGHPDKIVLSSRDITERRRTEDALREQTEVFQKISENMFDLISIADLAGNYKYIGSSRSLLGYDPETLVGKNFLDFIHPDDADEIASVFEDGLKRGEKVKKVEYRYKRADGSYSWFETIGKIIGDESVSPEELILSTRDITERKQAEQEKEKLHSQLAQAQKMESVGRLAGGVAHDFNNMLSIINGYAELALEMLEPADPVYKNIRDIHSAGKRSEDIVKQLLAFARRQTIRPARVDLNYTISNMLKMLQRLIGENIDLAWHPGNNLWPVKIDPSQLDQVMANLAVNARDAISDVGRLTIETKNVVVGEDHCRLYPYFVPGRYVLLVVTDSGRGMEKQVQDNLFEPFFTTKEIGQGTGLGLSTIYGIVKQNKGLINVYSEPGLGTTFKIYLPGHEEQKSGGSRPQTESTKQMQMPTGSETLLLVEDEPAILFMGREMLEKLGYTVLTAEKPADALRLVDENEGGIKLLITDVIMPEMNGRDLAARLSDSIPGLKTIYMSGYTADVIASHGVLEAGVRFIQKPFSLRELAVKVRQAIDQD